MALCISRRTGIPFRNLKDGLYDHLESIRDSEIIRKVREMSRAEIEVWLKKNFGHGKYWVKIMGGRGHIRTLYSNGEVL